jgi:hypothetical protein
MWRFKKISYLYTSRRLYEQIIFSTWRPSVLCNTHNLVWKTRRWRFNVPLLCTLTDPFCSFHMRSRWYDYYFFIITFIFLIVVLYEHVYLITFFSCMLQLLDANQDRQSFCRNTRMKLWLSEKGCNNLWITELRSSWYVGFQQFLFLSYYYFLNLLTFFS